MTRPPAGDHDRRKPAGPARGPGDTDSSTGFQDQPGEEALNRAVGGGPTTGRPDGGMTGGPTGGGVGGATGGDVTGGIEGGRSGSSDPSSDDAGGA